MKVITTLLFILVWLTIFSQEHNSHGSSWNTIVLSGNVTKSWNLKSEFNFRRTHFLSDWEQIVIRPSIHYKPVYNLDVAIGYSFIKNYSYSEFSIPINAKENNIWEQLIIKQPFKKFSLLHRLRVEQRFIDTIVNHEDVFFIDGNNYRNRLRYRFVISIPLKTFESKQQFQLLTYNETFLHLKGMRPNSFNQNWLFIGFGFKINKHATLKSGYHEIYAKSSTAYRTNHIWETTLFYKII